MDDKYIAPEHLPEWVTNICPDDLKANINHNSKATQSLSHTFYNNQNNYSNRYLTEPNNTIGGNLLIDQNERNLIKIAISKSKYNLSKAADMLGVSRTTLYRKIKKYEINHR
jgi:transcriptional regulator with PAS, ATPase and Fis domain